MLTEIIDLPSKGNLYPKDHPLSSGQIEIKYMTAREEDILTTKSYIEKDIVTDKLLQSVIVSNDIDPLDLTVGDREKVLLQTRIFGYGHDYTFTVGNKKNKKQYTVDLREVEDRGKPDLFDNTPFIEYELPVSKKKVIIKIFNGHDIVKLREEINAMEEKGIQYGPISLRLAHMIKSVDGDDSETTIREFAKDIPSRDSLALRTFVDVITPDVDLTTEVEGEEVEIPLGVNFFYPTG